MPHRTGKKGRKIGRNKEKCQRYRALGIREKNKLKRILKNNSYEEAVAYAKKHGLKIPEKGER